MKSNSDVGYFVFELHNRINTKLRGPNPFGGLKVTVRQNNLICYHPKTGQAFGFEFYEDTGTGSICYRDSERNPAPGHLIFEFKNFLREEFASFPRQITGSPPHIFHGFQREDVIVQLCAYMEMRLGWAFNRKSGERHTSFTVTEGNLFVLGIIYDTYLKDSFYFNPSASCYLPTLTPSRGPFDRGDFQKLLMLQETVLRGLDKIESRFNK